jgi:membrane protein YdbS with pleckstrin-like domain
MTESTSFLGRWWAKQHGRQYAITAVTSGASGLLLVACAYQLLFLQDHAEWNDFTGMAITGAVVSLILFLVAFPEFLRFKGHVAMLEEVMAIQSTSELRRRKADGVLAAEALGAGHLEHWNAFLESKGLRR